MAFISAPSVRILQPPALLWDSGTHLIATFGIRMSCLFGFFLLELVNDARLLYFLPHRILCFEIGCEFKNVDSELMLELGLH
jgi:hypothetical protein